MRMYMKVLTIKKSELYKKKANLFTFGCFFQPKFDDSEKGVYIECQTNYKHSRLKSSDIY